MDKVLRKISSSGSAISTPQQDETLRLRNDCSRKFVSKGSAVFVSSGEQFNVHHIFEVPTELLDFKQNNESAGVIPVHIQQLSDCLKSDSPSYFIMILSKKSLFSFDRNDVTVWRQCQLNTFGYTLIRETPAISNPTFREGAILQKPTMKRLQRGVASPSFYIENRRRLDVIMVKTDDDIVLQESSQIAIYLYGLQKFVFCESA